MKCKAARRSLSRYLDDELAALSRSALEVHLSQCAACRAELALQRRLWSLLGAIEPLEAPEILAGIERRLAEPPRRPYSLESLRRVTGLAAAAALLAVFSLAGVWAGSSCLETLQVREFEPAMTELLSSAPAGMEFGVACARPGVRP
jgi:anti-sigma factor RsiW